MSDRHDGDGPQPGGDVGASIDWEKIRQASKAACIALLVSQGMPPDKAEKCCRVLTGVGVAAGPFPPPPGWPPNWPWPPTPGWPWFPAPPPPPPPPPPPQPIGPSVVAGADPVDLEKERIKNRMRQEIEAEREEQRRLTKQAEDFDHQADNEKDDNVKKALRATADKNRKAADKIDDKIEGKKDMLKQV